MNIRCPKCSHLFKMTSSIIGMANRTLMKEIFKDKSWIGIPEIQETTDFSKATMHYYLNILIKEKTLEKKYDTSRYPPNVYYRLRKAKK